MRVHPLAMIAGAAALATEILTARLLAPFYGLGPFLQLVLLSVTLASLAIGFAIGARPARGDEGFAMSIAAGASGVWLLIALALRRPLLLWLERFGLSTDVVIAAVVLSGPCLILLGTIVPRAARLGSVGAADPVGKAAAVFSAFAIGGLAGALLASYLAPLGVQRLALSLALLQVAACFLFVGGGWRARAVVMGLALVAAAPQAVLARRGPGPAGSVPAKVVQSLRGEIRVLDREGSRYLVEDGAIQNVVEPATRTGLRRPEAALGLVRFLLPAPGKILIAGLRGGSLARDFQSAGWTVDVVDPDRSAFEIARSHFGLLPGEARVVAAEPRLYLRRTNESYDAIVLDVLGDGFPPCDLMTREFMALAERRLFQGGMLALVVDAMGWDDVLVRSIAATARAEFDTVLALPTGEPPNTLGSVIVVAADRPLALDEESLPNPYEKLSDPLAHWHTIQVNHAWDNRYAPDTRGVPILTDDRNPSERWGERINRAARRELHSFFGAAASW